MCRWSWWDKHMLRSRCICTGHFIPASVHMCIWTEAGLCVCVCVCLSPCASSHLPLTWTRLGFPAVCRAMWRTHAGARVQRWAANRRLSRHEPASLPLPLPLSLTFTLPSLPRTLPVQPSSPSLGRARLPHSLDSEPRHRLYPAEITWTLVCFCHMRAILFQLAESRLTSRSTTINNNNNNHNPSVHALCFRSNTAGGW